MKRLLSVICIILGLFALTAHAQAVNNRTFTIDPVPALQPGQTAPTEWRLYCGVTADTTTWVKATALVKTTALPALTSGVVALADTLNYCAATFAGAAGGLESVYSNVVYAKPFASPVIKITMDITIWFENLAEGVNPMAAIKVNGVTVK